jgi:hypothetical protein
MATNLQLIQSVNISTSQSTTSVTNCFTSNYDFYKIVSSGISTAGTTAVTLNMRLIDSGGSVISDSEYDYAHQIMRTDASFTEQNATSQTKFYRPFAESTDQAPDSQGAIIYVFNPNDSSSYTFIAYQNMDSGSSLHIGMKGVGLHKVAEQITGFQLVEDNGSRPYDTGNISVYGVK